MFQVQMTTAAGETMTVGVKFETRNEAEVWMRNAREQGMFTDGRDVGGNLYAPNATRIVEVQS